ncbi:hypothetical protein V8E52_006269 [Russula decolorans]
MLFKPLRLKLPDSNSVPRRYTPISSFSTIATIVHFAALPPTCHLPNCPTPLSDSHAFEAHYATHHARVCSSSGCGCVFPDARLLELHLKYTENCVPPPVSSRTFANPKARRLHLIAVQATAQAYSVDHGAHVPLAQRETQMADGEPA